MRDKTDEHGVPLLSKDDIELKAEEVISYFDTSLLMRPQLIPLREFVAALGDAFDLAHDYTLDLGETKHGKKILGKTRLRPLTLFVDASLANDARFPFVLGHELGHVVLHRSVDLKRTGYAEQEIIDSERDFVTGKKLLNTSRGWLEWQANRFSSAVLMPRTSIRHAVEQAQEERGITRNLGYIILEDKRYSICDYVAVQSRLELLYGVNSTNVECRLRDLDILIDRRDLNVKHISELFSARS